MSRRMPPYPGVSFPDLNRSAAFTRPFDNHTEKQELEDTAVMVSLVLGCGVGVPDSLP